MREIKFRAWDKRTKEMCEVIEIRIGSMVYLKPKVGHPFYRDITDVELLHYSGVKDKNGREICDGDIIKCEVDERIAEVSFKTGCFWYEDKEGNYGELHNVLTSNLEVIGNIYENKDLLNEHP